MRQVSLGHWPAMSGLAAAAEWERLRAVRDAGQDLAVDRRMERAADAERKRARQARGTTVLTVRKVCDAFLESYEASVAKKTHAAAKRLAGDAARGNGSSQPGRHAGDRVARGHFQVPARRGRAMDFGAVRARPAAAAPSRPGVPSAASRARVGRGLGLVVRGDLTKLRRVRLLTQP
jgi:hypothetical protein